MPDPSAVALRYKQHQNIRLSAVSYNMPISGASEGNKLLLDKKDFENPIVTMFEGKTDKDKFSKQAITNMLPSWLDNLGENLKTIGVYYKFVKDGMWNISTLDKLPEDKRDVLVIGAGPSFDENLDKLKPGKMKKYNLIVADRVLIPLLENNIIPDYVILLDSDKIFYEFINHELVQKNASNLKFIVNSVVHPKVLNKLLFELHSNTCLFNMIVDDYRSINSITRFMHHLTSVPSFLTGSCSGTACVQIAKLFNPKRIGFIGIDFSYPSDIDIKTTQYYHIFEKEYDCDPKALFKNIVIENSNVQVISDPIFQFYSDELKEYLESDDGITFYNLSNTSILSGKNIKRMSIEEFLKSITPP